MEEEGLGKEREREVGRVRPARWGMGLGVL